MKETYKKGKETLETKLTQPRETSLSNHQSQSKDLFDDRIIKFESLKFHFQHNKKK